MKLFRKQKAVIVRFSENTNWHGVGPAVQSVGVAKLVWTIVFLAALGVCIWQLVGVFKRFLSNETSTSYVLGFEELDFPAVTVCNLNGFKYSQLPNVLVLIALIAYFQNLDQALARGTLYTNKTLSGRKRREIPSGLQLDDFQSVNDEVKGVKAEDFFLLVIESLYENREREEWRKIHMPNWDAMLRESQGQQKSTYSPGNSSTTELISTTTETKIESEDLLKRVKRGPCDPYSCSNPTGLQPDVKVVSYTLTTGACNGKFVTNTVITLGCANNKGIASCFGISSCSLNITCQADTTWSPTGTNVPCVKGLCDPPTLSVGLSITTDPNTFDDNNLNKYIQNTIATFSCSSGYSLLCNTSNCRTWMRCRSSGVWNLTEPDYPVCVEATTTTTSTTTTTTTPPCPTLCPDGFSSDSTSNFCFGLLPGTDGTPVTYDTTLCDSAASPYVSTMPKLTTSLMWTDFLAIQTAMIPDTSTCVWLGLIRTSTSIPPVNSDFKWSDGTSLSLSSPPWILDITLTTGTYASTYYDILTDQMYWTGSSATDTCAVMCMAKTIACPTYTYANKPSASQLSYEFGCNRTAGTKVTFSCNTNYVMLPPYANLTAKCLQGGTWDNQITPNILCMAPCSYINLAGAVVSYSNTGVGGLGQLYLFNTSAVISCSTGYSLFGTPGGVTQTYCMNGVWANSSNFPSCYKNCNPIPLGTGMLRVTYDNNTIPHTSQANVTCQSPQYDLDPKGGNPVCFYGSWSYQVDCVPVCPQIAPTNALVYANYSTSGPLYNGTVRTFYCPIYYTVIPVLTKWTCQSDGTWDSAVQPICSASCLKFGILSAASTYTVNYQNPLATLTYTSANVTCNGACKLYGPINYTCLPVLPNPQWSPNPNSTFCATPCLDSDIIYNDQTSANAVITYSDTQTVSGIVYHADSSRVDVVCNPTYVMANGNPTRYCWNGTWTGMKPECLAPCPQWPNSDLSYTVLPPTVSDSTLAHNTTAKISCIDPPKYVLTGVTANTVHFVCNNGTWVKPAGNPECMAPCQAFTIPNIQTPVYSDPTYMRHDTNVTIQCSNDYVMRGNATLQCKNGTWTTPVMPICFPSCQSISIANSEIEYQWTSLNLTNSDRIENTTALIACVNSSYFLTTNDNSLKNVGSSMIAKCTNGQTWDQPLPQCLLGCKNLTNTIYQALFSYTDSDYFIAGSSVNVSCVYGWTLTGPSVLACQSNGLWSPDPINIRCHDPCRTINPPILYSTSNYSDFTTQNVGGIVAYAYQTTVDVTCDQYFVLSGPTHFTCVDNGTWSPPPTNMTCHPPCNPNATGYNLNIISTFSDPNHIHNSSVTFSCPDRYTLSGDPIEYCKDGVWQVTIQPECLNPCLSLNLSYGSIAYSDPLANYTTLILHNTTVSLSCATNFMLTNTSGMGPGPNNFKCYNGSYTIAEQPQCLATCPNSTFPNGRVTYANKYLLDTTDVSFVCNTGYYIDDPGCAPACEVENSTARCINGSWSYWPVCYKMCPVLSVTQTVARVSYTHSQRIERSFANFTCVNDTQGHSYIVKYNDILQCQANGQWNLPIPPCTIQCPPLEFTIPNTYPVPPNLTLTYSDGINNRTPSTWIDFSCPSGFIVFGNVMTTCMNDSSWSPAPPSTMDSPYCLVMPKVVQQMLESLDLNSPSTWKATEASALAYLATTLTPEELSNISYPKAELIPGCWFNEKQCAESDWETNLDPAQGACYKYNNKNPTLHKVSRPGAKYGLELLLNTNQSEYIGATDKAGFLIIIHAPGDTIFADSGGYRIPPGFQTNLAINYGVEIHQPPPYGTCAQDRSSVNVFYYKTSYSTEGCFRSCLQYLTVKGCGCGDPRYPLVGGATSCPVTQKNCVDEVAGKTTPTLMNQVCGCPSPCLLKNYPATISQSVWPSRVDPILNYMIECNRSGNIFSPTLQASKFQNCYRYFREDWAVVNIYFNSLAFETITEEPSYTIFNLLTDMGSNLGLFLGGSFITLAETVQLILSLILSVCLKPPPEPEPPGPELTDVEREAKLAEYRQMLRELKAKRENEDEDDDSDESEEENEEKATKI